MSASPTAGIDLRLRTEHFRQAIAESKRELSGLATAGSQSFQSMKPSVDQTTNSVKELNKNTKETASSLKLVLTSSMATATQIGGLAFQFKNLDDTERNLQKRQLDVRKTTIELEQAQAKLNEMRTSGKYTLDEIIIQEERLKVKQDELVLKGQEVEEAQDKINQSYWQFGTQVFGVAMSALTNIFAAKTAMVGANAAAAGSEGAFTAATLGSTRAIWGKTFAMLSNPLFAIPTAIAIAGAVALVATNTWGLRDAIFGTTEAIKENTTAMQGGQAVLPQYATSLGQVGASANYADAHLKGLAQTSARTAESIARDTETVMRSQMTLQQALDSVGKKKQGFAEDNRFFIDQTKAELEEIQRQHEAIKEIDEANLKAAQAIRIQQNVRAQQIAINIAAGTHNRTGGFSLYQGRARPWDALGLNISSTNDFGILSLGPHSIRQNGPMTSLIQDIFGAPSYSRAYNPVYPMGGDAWAAISAAEYYAKSINDITTGRTKDGKHSTLTPQWIIAAAAEADRIENERRRQQKNPFGYFTSGGRVSRTISDLLGSIPEAFRPTRLGSDRSVILNNAQAAAAAWKQTADFLASEGVAIPSPREIMRGGKGNGMIYYADFDAGKALAEAIAEANIRRKNRISGTYFNGKIDQVATQSGIAVSKLVSMAHGNPDSVIDIMGQYRYYERELMAATAT